MKAFSDKTNITETLVLDLERVENIMGKGENTGYHNFFKALLSRVIGSKCLKNVRHSSAKQGVQLF